MMLTAISLVVNGIFLLLALGLSFRMLRAGTTHSLNYGDYEIQERMKWIILRSILAMVFVGLAAAIFNLVQIL